jgi:hypothetical protein
MENSQSDQPTPQEIAAAGKQLQALAQRLSDDRKNKLVQAAEPQVAQTLKDYVAKIESVSKLYAVWQDNQDHVFKHPALAQVWQDLGKRGAPNRVMLKTALEQMDDAAPVKQKPEGRPDWEQGLWSAYESARNKMLDDAARTIRSGGPSSWSGVSAQVVTAMKSLFIAAEQLTVHCGGIDRLWSQFRTADETTPSLLKLHQDAEKVLAAAGELRPPIEPLLNRAARIVNVAALIVPRFPRQP